MKDKQLAQYKKTAKAYPIEMSQEDVSNFTKELQEFLSDKLGNRAYVLSYGFETQIAGKYLLNNGLIGLERPMYSGRQWIA